MFRLVSTEPSSGWAF